ncbi:MAG: trypsin-like peptidase domain-containing protein, partial [Verrucomicrobia bacterium]|nr:trypsin-like peptidase domain-containing protein [Cytophagales bacterium]
MNAELYDLIERYLKGTLPDEEKSRLEQNLAQDSYLASEVAEYSKLNQGFQTYKKRNQLKAKLNTIHKEIKSSQNLPRKSQVYSLKVLGRRYFPTMAVAASVAIITVLSTFYIHNYLRLLQQEQTKNFVELSQSIKNTEKQIKKAVNEADNKQPEREASSTATGFVIAANGYLVTNYHVIRGKYDSLRVESMSDHKNYLVEVVESDADLDLAILKIIDKNFKGFARLPYAIASRDFDLGEPVYTLAYPRNDMVFGEGSISARSDNQGDTTKYQVSIPVNPGNSGSPVFDNFGNLVAIVS